MSTNFSFIVLLTHGKMTNVALYLKVDCNKRNKINWKVTKEINNFTSNRNNFLYLLLI